MGPGSASYRENLTPRVMDDRSGAAFSNGFSNLRMGARDSWSRGVKSAMKKALLANNTK
jgi:hypothetical protein